MRFEPVWMSSLAHMTRFDELNAQTHWLPRSLGAYHFPDDFPRMEFIRYLGQQLAFPIVMFAEGKMEVGDDAVSFIAYNRTNRSPSRADKTKLHLRSDLEFRLNASEIIAVEAMPWRSPVLRYYDMPFTRVQTNRADAVLRDFLVCVGGTGVSMGKVRERSAQLAAELQRLKSA